MESNRSRSHMMEFIRSDVGSVVAVVVITIPLAGLAVLVARSGIEALRVWAWVTTVLIPAAAVAGWWARALLARAESRGMGVGMEHTLDVVRAVRPAKETVRDTLVTAQGAAELPQPGAFEIVRREKRVIDL